LRDGSSTGTERGLSSTCASSAGLAARGMRRLVSPEHEERFRRILADFEQRPGGDYAELLRRGQVVSPPGVDIEAWRAEIRAKARADKIRVATIRDGEVAIAIRQREYSDAEVRAELERGECMRRLGAQARELGHELSPWLRQDDESIAFCMRCTAHVYVRTSGDWVVDEDGLRELCEGLV
jgi:hypothetical protein